VHKIQEDLQHKRYCTATFIDISQAFNKVWHPGLLYKLKRTLPHPLYSILKSYLTNRVFQVRYQDEYTSLYNIQSGVPQGSILGPVLYSIFTADLPVSDQTLIATYADDTAILASNTDPLTTGRHLQQHLEKLEHWLKRWRIRANESKSTHITFTLRCGECPAVYLNGTIVPQRTTIKYLGIHLDRRLTWKPHIQSKRKQLGLLLQRMYWIIGRKSKLSLPNKLLIYKTILKPVWTYGAPLWGTASQSNIDLIQRLQNRILRMATDAPWYVPNQVLHTDLLIPTVREEISRLSSNYKAKIEVHPNKLSTFLLETQGPGRLRRHSPFDLLHSFKT